ncbi:MAG: sel1 repeat family protein [Alphaproteobacteria bacterium]|nr:sel1 repeat family protein [Alphaproteobacteria bacterium]
MMRRSFGFVMAIGGALMLVQPGLVHAQEQAQAQAPVQPQTPMAMMEAAANRGDAIAQTNLGIAHEFGYGVAQNPQEAVKWYQRAATQGDVRAQFYLSGCYEMGTGVAQDFVQAYYWLSVAVANSSPASSGYVEMIRRRDRLGRTRLKPDQIADAQKRSREWKPQKEAAK